MYTLGLKKEYGTYQPACIFHDGEAVLIIQGLPVNTKLEDLDEEMYGERLAFGLKVVELLNNDEQLTRFVDTLMKGIE